MTRPFDDDWRRWIAENLLLDGTPDALAQVLVSHGFAPDDAAREIGTALASPYLQGGTRLCNRLRKRDWMLSVHSTLARLRTNGDRIERHARLSRDAFFDMYYYSNRPVILTGTFDGWPARMKWNFDYFRARCGECEVEVQFGRDSDARYEINQPKHKRMMRFRDYVDLVERSGKTNDFYMTANNTSHNRTALAALWDDVAPIAPYLDPTSPDTGFFWLGPAGTKTPFHHDLTNNFMAQVIGRKRVMLVSSLDTPSMYNDLHCYSQVDGGALDYARFERLKDVQVLECVIEPGDLLFLPIGWWHYVEGLDPSVTMTFINFAAPNDFAHTYQTYHAV